MKFKPLMVIAIVGIFTGILSAYIYNEKIESQKPLSVNQNPYETGVYATGIVESAQSNSSNVNIYAEVSGRVTNVFVHDGQMLKKNDPLLQIDDSIQREIVAKDQAAVKYARANLINVQEQLQKIKKSYQLNHQSISQNTLDNAINAVIIAKENVHVTEKQLSSDLALLAQYFVHAPINGVVLRVEVAKGAYVSPQGTYDTYTQGMLPAVVMGDVSPNMQVRCYVDEILVPQLPDSAKLEATMFIRGLSSKSVPLTFVSIQPYTIPNIQLSDERQERVDVRVLPIVFRFKKPTDVQIFPGQLVDVYLKGKA